MDEDFYIEDSSLLKIVVTFIIFLSAIAFGYYYYSHYFVNIYFKPKKFEVELGDVLSSDLNDYIDCINCNNFRLDVSNVLVDENNRTISPGEYSYKITGNNKIKKGKIIVKDTTSPKVITKDLNVGINEEFDVSDFVLSCEDLSLPCKVSYSNPDSYDLNNSEGTYNLEIIVSDSLGNSTVEKVVLNVGKDYSYEEEKASDFDVSHISNSESEWDETFTVKFDKALNEDKSEFDEKVKTLSAVEYDFNKDIKNKEMILAYNKYNYVIGISLKITFTDDSVLFVTDDNSKIKEEE